MMPGLNFEHIPPIHIPFRFFNTAPWMAVLAALVLLSGSDDTSLASQWSAELLAMTHLFTLGFMAMTMIGALFQVLPVISGETIPAGARVATIVHLALVIGTLILATAFISRQTSIFAIAVPILLLAFMVFLLALGFRLVKNISGGESINAIRFAAISLLVTVVLGAMRALAYHFPELYQVFGHIIYSHIAWGLAGWLSLLVMGVSFQVIPMFHVTPNFSRQLTKKLPLIMFTALMVMSVIPWPPIQHLMLLVLCATISVYACYAIKLLSMRRRKLPDTTVRFWRLGLGSCLLTVSLLLVRYFDDVLNIKLLATAYESINVAIGCMAIMGFACSVILGMLHKIIPFLIYMHLQRQCGGNYAAVKSLPTMLDIIPATRGHIQVYLHVAMLILVLGAILYPPLVMLAGLAMMLDFACLGYTVNRASWLYWTTSKQLQDLQAPS